MNKTVEYYAYHEIETLRLLSSLAKSFCSKQGVEYEFASVVINANIAEYILHLLIHLCSDEVKKVCESNKSKVSLRQIDSTGKLNYKKVETLKYFEFKNRNEIIFLLKKILGDRDNIFHNLVRAETKKINISQAIKDIQSNTDKLRLLIGETLDDIFEK